jgi:transposase
MAKSITYIGLGVHKDAIAVALAEASLRGEVRERGKIPKSPATLKALAVKLASTRRDLQACYGAGPCGYGIHRQLAGMGHDCAVVAPSSIPRKPGGGDLDGPARRDQPCQAAPRR